MSDIVGHPAALMLSALWSTVSSLMIKKKPCVNGLLVYTACVLFYAGLTVYDLDSGCECMETVQSCQNKSYFCVYYVKCSYTIL
jgi:hypothetical protein